MVDRQAIVVEEAEGGPEEEGGTVGLLEGDARNGQRVGDRLPVR